MITDNKHYQIIRIICSGNIKLAGGRFRAHPKDSNKTIVDYVLCLDLNAPNVPKVFLDGTISMLIIQDAESIRKQIDEMGFRAT